jgi:hypothetical protein
MTPPPPVRERIAESGTKCNPDVNGSRLSSGPAPGVCPPRSPVRTNFRVTDSACHKVRDVALDDHTSVDARPTVLAARQAIGPRLGPSDDGEGPRAWTYLEIADDDELVGDRRRQVLSPER